MKSEVIWKGPSHKWVVLGRDAERRDDVIDTNQFAIIGDAGTMLLDPGGIEIFPRVLAELTRYVAPEDIKVILSSHQDPDIISSLSMWLDLCGDVKIYTSWLWESFIAHFCMGEAVSFDTLPDEGGVIRVGGGLQVEAVPAHYCHSPGNFGLFDPASRILFSGDLGAALLPDTHQQLYVEDFHEHVSFMTGFHQRWMPANKPLRQWVARARALKPSMICPQHGSIFRGDEVGLFLDWLEQLDVEACDPMAVEAAV